MKRRLSNDPAGSGDGPRRRRQPQISCNFCRSKKLKCDRGQPCSNCTARGIQCDGQSLPAVSRALGPSPAPDADVLERLRRLEDAVFGPSASPANLNAVHHDSQTASSSGPILDRSNDLDYNNSGESLALDDCDTFTFRIASSDEYAGARHTDIRCVDLPSREDALGLYKYYMESSASPVPSIMHPPLVQAMIEDVYTQLRQGHKISLGSAALILSISAASACVWDDDFPPSYNFASEVDAAAQCVVWRCAAWDLLDQAQRASLNSVDAIQARLILADVLYNIEGTTSRFRYIQSCARAAAYEIRLHLTDLPGNTSTDTPVLREMKRRLWWYIAATDWLQSTMGGNIDRVYSVNPKHMRVNYPRHIPEDSDPTVPLCRDWSETTVMHQNVRIRLAEVLRETVDALPLGSGDVDTLPYSKIAALDNQFEQIFTEYPPFDMSNIPSDAAPRRITIQRAIGYLSIQARRARFLRPFIQIRNLPEKFEVFRRKCLNAAQIVMETASSVLSETVDTPGSTASDNQRSHSRGTASKSQRSPYHSGLVINHLFMACAVLAADPSLRGGPDGTTSILDAETERRRAQLANACRLLEKAGEKSPMALGMVRRLVGVLRKHRIHGVGEDKNAPTSFQEVKRSDSSAMVINSEDISLESQTDPVRQAMTVDLSGSDLAQHQLQQQQQELDSQNWAYDPLDPNALTGIWNDFIGTDPTNSGWQQLFADLDYLSGGM